MVWVCDHCHYDFEALTKESQCPDCGKEGHIRKASEQEAREFDCRKEEDVWADAIPAKVG